MPTPTSPGLKQPSAQPTNKQATKEALKALSANSGGAGLRMRQASVRSFESVAKAAARPLPTPGVKKSITPAARPLPTPSAGKRSLPTRPAAATNGGGKSAKRSLKDFEVLEMLGTQQIFFVQNKNITNVIDRPWCIRSCIPRETEGES
jgi:hypothetical protein